MDQTFIRSLIDKAFGTMLRHGLSALGLWLTAKGIGTLSGETQNNLTEIALGLISFIGAFLWSIYRSHVATVKVDRLQASMLRIGGAPTPRDPPAPTSIIAPLLIAFMAASMTGCSSISHFDQNSYNSTVELKSETAALIAHAGEPIDDFQSKIDALKVKLTAQLAYEQGKGKPNVLSSKQWEILISEKHNLLGKLLWKWETNVPITAPYLTEKKIQIADAFNQILRLEGSKKK